MRLLIQTSSYLFVCLGALCLSTCTGLAASDADWYVFSPRNDPAPGEIGMQAWLEKPAGKHGRIHRQKDQLIYNDTPIKLWGINLCYGTCAPEKALAEKRAAFYPKYGINSVRLHKYGDGPGWAGIQSEDSFVEFDPDGLDRMDYQVAQFKAQGITVLLSAIFGAQKLGPADRKYVPFLEEFGQFDGRKKRITTPHSAVHHSPELQTVQIMQMVNLLKHKNPYTGLTYAEDPVVAYVEIINEQSILFYSSMAPLKASATLRRSVAQRFSTWLRHRYHSHAGLIEAWGQAAMGGFDNEGFGTRQEHLDKNNILPLGNPWYWDPVQLNGSQSFRKQRLLDTMEFLYDQQCAFYDRFVQAMRHVGYQGEILGSNWQAGRALSHYYNLHSDYRVGTIDRHNYFGGGKNPFNAASMLATPGSGMLSSGMQQVADRPFMLSEWIHVYPNEWGAEGPALLGAYGMGLQGWDASYMFQNRDNGGFSDVIGRDRWDVTAPQILGVFPAVARQVLRQDVKESPVAATRNVHMDSLKLGHLDFDDTTTQQYDVKSFSSDKVPAQTLAVARSVVTFTDTLQTTPAFDLSPFQQDAQLVSSTRQLAWTPGQNNQDGYFTLQTPHTCAVVGFAQDLPCHLGQVTMTPKSRFSVIYVTARDLKDTLMNGNALLVVAMARARNTGMILNDTQDAVLEKGRAPIRMEPVKATLRIRRPGQPTVTLLDHDGMRTSRQLPIQNGLFEIDGARDKTPYYLVEY